jgi:hypothetical protein
MFDAPRPLSRHEACAWLGVSLSLFDKELKAQRIRGRRIGNKRLVFLPSDLQAYLEAK